MPLFDFPSKKEMKQGNKIHIVIYVPSTKNLSQKISEKQFKARVKETVRFLDSLFGGTTRIRGVGAYNLGNKIVSEKVAVVETFAKSPDYQKADLKVKAFLRKKKRMWGQQSMGYQFEETLIFV